MSSAASIGTEIKPLVLRLMDEGELVLPSGKEPFLLDDKEHAWFVEDGKVEVFTVSVHDGEPTGARSHFVSVDAGEMMFGMDLARYGMGSGFLAVGRIGTRLRKISLVRLQQLAKSDEYVPELSALLDLWVINLSRSLTRDIIPGPLVDVNLSEGQRVSLENTQKGRSNKGAVWLKVTEGDLLFIGMEALIFSGANVLFPLTVDTWVEASNASETSTSIEALPLENVVADPSVWWGLDLFHEALCQCEFINKKLATVDEFNRLKSKAEYSDEARRAAYADLASVLSRKKEEEKEVAGADVQDAIFQAIRKVGDHLGINIKRHPAPREKANLEERVAEIAKASRFRSRPVALRDDWYNRDMGPLFCFWQESKNPVALIPNGPRSYTLFDTTEGTKMAVNDAVAAKLSPFGLTFYRPYPDGPMNVWDLIKFGAYGVKSDLWMLLAMGVTLGMLGMLAPYATGQIFDSAIPQADRTLLTQFVLALFVAALAQSAFKIVQSISVIRLQGKMDYSIQAALWDRLLNLPATFFRKYESGDLADRAAGVNTIRDLLAGAGVAAILGAVSSVFYIFLMFKYSVQMALLAMGLTFVFVSATTTMNYMQLRYQRDAMKLNGKITGMVLQLISGVAKLRVSGAENHAFRVWARDFASQRKINFSMSSIQNWGSVFNSSFPILSNMAIFFTLVALQSSKKVSMTTGDFIAFTAAYGLFLAAMQALAGASMHLLGIVPVYERFRPILTEVPETDESKAYPGKLSGEIELSHIHFKYAEDSPWILKDVSLKINPGEFVAFVGGSGSGKSTMMRLMLGFETPQKGTVYYDGQDLNTLDLREVRQQLGVVLQTSRVLPTDIFRNIIGTSSLTIEDAWAAAEAAGLADDIKEMPMGMHTYVAEGGGGFSGGQKQRLLIARSIVHRPRILFLDEATSALDNRTQAIVTQSMNKLQATRIVIAHRLSTIVDADRICVLDQGVLKETGSYDELMRLDGLFAQLAKRQIA
ncbi:MAG: NHLP bacteriocin export ABC transporter permease/ATPase subunit [Thermoanaerobaculia bacterium]